MAAAIPIITAAAIGSSIVYTQKTAIDQQKQIRKSNRAARED